MDEFDFRWDNALILAVLALVVYQQLTANDQQPRSTQRQPRQR
jgi:hypothetical protein